MTTLAIDIGGTKLAAALIGADGQIRDRRELPTPASQTPEALRDALSALVSPLQAHAQRVAIASTGIIRDGSLLALNPHNLGGLLHFPLVKTLEQLTNLPTIAINDAQAAAWAEFQALDGDITDMVFITVSTGVGGGVVSGCKLLTGHLTKTDWRLFRYRPACSGPGLYLQRWRIGRCTGPNHRRVDRSTSGSGYCAGIALVQSDVRGDPADWAGYAFSRSALVAPGSVAYS